MISFGDRITDNKKGKTGVVYAKSKTLGVKFEWISGGTSEWTSIKDINNEMFAGELRYLHVKRGDV